MSWSAGGAEGCEVLETGLGALTECGRVVSEDDVLLENGAVSSEDASRFRFKVVDAVGRAAEPRGTFGPVEGRDDTLSFVSTGRGVFVMPAVPFGVLVKVVVRLLRRDGPARGYGPVPILGILLFVCVCLSTAIFEICGF